ncbi:MAG TPA: fumarylacetoacetate hydrolase family protein [Actinomycetota bacterium]|nr:fumarylacetoacetate hydrolase family protein [Actinomycetota bacterium]
MIDDGLAREAAAALLRAAEDRLPIPPLTERWPELTAEDGYRIQQHVVRARLDAGEAVVGYKVGLTSRAMQEMMGVDQPDYGPILSGMLASDGEAIPTSDLIQPRVETEIAFVLGEPLQGPGLSAIDVLRATAGVTAAIEVIDSRIEGWRIKLADTIADLASSARVVLAGRLLPVDGTDLRLVGCVLERNGEVVATGAGAAALGNPAHAVAWAANTLGALGVRMEPGHVVMPGALHAAVPAAAGDVFTASFDRLGPVTVRFV